MNLILFNDEREVRLIPGKDPRANHIRKVLRLGLGDPVFVGIANGRLGKGVIQQDDDAGIAIAVQWEATPPPVYPIHLLVGLPRPQTARRILFEAACLGVSTISFFQADKGEPSYAKSKLWTTDEWRERLWLGAEQGFATQLPAVEHSPDLKTALTAESSAVRVALDVYEGQCRLSEVTFQTGVAATLAVGSERGWSAQEREQLRGGGFQLVHLGERVLRTETACIAAISIALARMGVA